jgi:tetratricopeptide (TPR) repeat protein
MSLFIPDDQPDVARWRATRAEIEEAMLLCRYVAEVLAPEEARQWEVDDEDVDPRLREPDRDLGGLAAALRERWHLGVALLGVAAAEGVSGSAPPLLARDPHDLESPMWATLVARWTKPEVARAWAQLRPELPPGLWPELTRRLDERLSRAAHDDDGQKTADDASPTRQLEAPPNPTANHDGGQMAADAPSRTHQVEAPRTLPANHDGGQETADAVSPIGQIEAPPNPPANQGWRWLVGVAAVAAAAMITLTPGSQPDAPLPPVDPMRPPQTFFTFKIDPSTSRGNGAATLDCTAQARSVVADASLRALAQAGWQAAAPCSDVPGDPARRICALARGAEAGALVIDTPLAGERLDVRVTFAPRGGANAETGAGVEAAVAAALATDLPGMPQECGAAQATCPLVEPPGSEAWIGALEELFEASAWSALACVFRELGGSARPEEEVARDLAVILQTLDDREAARRWYERSISLAVARPAPLVEADTRSSFGDLLRVTGDHAGAAAQFNAGLRALEAFAANTEEEATTAAENRAHLLGRRALLLDDIGDQPSAIDAYRAAIDAMSQLADPDPNMIFPLEHSLATALRRTGDLDGAEAAAQRALALSNQRSTGAMLALATIAWDRGQLMSAKLQFEEVLRLRRAGGKPASIATALTTYAAFLLETQGVDAARPALEEAVALHERQPILNVNDYLPALGNLAVLELRAAWEARAANDTTAAERAADRAATWIARERSVYTSATGVEPAVFATLLSHEARLAWTRGDLPAAKAAYEEALTLIGAHPASHAWAESGTQTDLARVVAAMGDTDAAVALAEQAFDAVQRTVEAALPLLAERQRLDLVRRHRVELNTLLSITSDASAHARIARWKGMVRRSLLAQRSPLTRPELISPEAWDAWLVGRQIAATAAYNAAASGTVQVQPAAALPEARALPPELADEIERAVARQRADTPGATEAIADGALCEALTAKRASLVDIVRFREELPATPWRSRVRYTAFVVAPDATGCRRARVDLGDATMVEPMITRWRDALERPTAAPTLRTMEAEVGAWWAAVDRELGPGRVVVAPDGALVAAPFAAMPVTASGTPGELIWRPLTTVRDVLVVDAASELLRPAAARAGVGLLAVGEPDFGGAAQATDGVASRSATPCERPAAAWTPLPGSGREAAAVAQSLQPPAGFACAGAVCDVAGARSSPAVVLLGANARRDAVLAAMAGKRWIHVATHGWVGGPDCRTGFDPILSLETHPMDRVGLVLAGANAAGERWRDGLITAKDLMGVDLRGAEAVILSACASGGGGFIDGEAAMGLSRAASVAGAANTLVSLWDLDDEATLPFMQALYGHLATGASIVEAVNQTQREAASRAPAYSGGREAGWAAWQITGSVPPEW